MQCHQWLGRWGMITTFSDKPINPTIGDCLFSAVRYVESYKPFRQHLALMLHKDHKLTVNKKMGIDKTPSSTHTCRDWSRCRDVPRIPLRRAELPLVALGIEAEHCQLPSPSSPTSKLWFRFQPPEREGSYYLASSSQDW